MKDRRYVAGITNFAIIMVLGLLFVSTVWTTSTAVINYSNEAIYSGNREGDKVSLMINVYWGEEYIEQIMDTFDNYNFKTTFFIGGKWAEKNGELIKKMDERGYEIANHGYLHRDASKLDETGNRQEIVITQKLLASITNKQTNLFAPPSGDLSNSMFKVAKAEGYRVIMWTRDTIDWRDKNAKLVYDRAIKDLKAGDLILMHPSAHTLEALPKILDYIKMSGLKADIVTNTLAE